MYVLVEELRRAAPRPRTVPGLAVRLRVSERTVQRDMQALLAVGVPVRNAAGRGGGWFVDAQFTLPPISLTGPQALALVVALAGTDDVGAFGGPAREAMLKITAAMAGSGAAASRGPARERPTGCGTRPAGARPGDPPCAVSLRTEPSPESP